MIKHISKVLGTIAVLALCVLSGSNAYAQNRTVSGVVVDNAGLPVIGYGVQKKSDLTGSVASVRSEELVNRSISDAASALQGKGAGFKSNHNEYFPIPYDVLELNDQLQQNPYWAQ